MYNSEWFVRLGTLGFNLIMLNLLWLFFTVIGFGFFGLFPATVALFAVLRDIIISRDDQQIIKKFWHFYKKDWLVSNALGYLYSLILIILYLNVKVIHLIEQRTLYVIVMSITIVVGLVILIAFLYLFPLFVHFKFKWWTYPKYAVILTIAKPFHTVLLIILLVVVIYLYNRFPALIVLFGVSSFGYIVMKISSLSFPTKSN